MHLSQTSIDPEKWKYASYSGFRSQWGSSCNGALHHPHCPHDFPTPGISTPTWGFPTSGRRKEGGTPRFGAVAKCAANLGHPHTLPKLNSHTPWEGGGRARAFEVELFPQTTESEIELVSEVGFLLEHGIEETDHAEDLAPKLVERDRRLAAGCLAEGLEGGGPALGDDGLK